MFADVVGSTALAERFDPETFRELMLAFLERMAAVVESHGGVIEHLAGDGVMGVFGTEVAQGDDALRAVRAGREMFEQLEALNDEIEPRLDTRLEMRVGVNTGTVVVGRQVAGRTVSLGDTMNVAARLQSWAPAGGLVIGEETHRLVRREVEAEHAGRLDLRGRREPIAAFRVLGAATRDAVPLSDRPLLGRRRELSLLTVAFERSVARDSPEFITLLGDAGSGKTRLLAEVVELYRERALVLVGRCLSYGEGITYWALAEIVRQAAGITDADDAGSARAKLAGALNGAEGADGASAQLAQLIGVEPASDHGDQILWAVRRLLEARARRQPVVAVVEDLHWAEPQLLELVERLTASLAAPVLLACTARFDLLSRRPDWSDACPTIVTVGPLPEREVDTLVGELVGDALPGETRARLVELAAGNPLFVEQVVHMLIDDGRLRRSEEGWVAVGDLDAVEVPPSIEATLASRVDHLSEPERRCAEHAAVIGMEFWANAIETMVPGAAEEPLAGLARKLVIEPVRRRTVSSDMLRFRHLLLRDAVYEAIPKARRALLHELVGDWMLEWTNDRRGEAEEIVGYHFEAAARYHGELLGGAEASERVAARAAEHLMEAGRRAAARQDDATAASFYSRAVALMGDDDARLEPLMALGTALVREGETSRAEEALAELRRRAARGDDPRTEAQVRTLELSLRRQTEPAWWAEHGRPGAAELTGVFQQLGDDLGAAKAWHLLGTAHSDRGEQAAAQEAFEHALEFARGAGDQGVEAWIRYWLLQVAVFGPAPCDRVVARAREDLDWARAHGNRSLEGSTLAGMGEMLARSGHPHDAQAAFDEARAIFSELGQPSHVAYLAISTAAVEPLASDPPAAEAELRSALTYFESIGAKHIIATVAPMLAVPVAAQGRLDEALELTRRAEAVVAPDDLDAQVKWRLARAGALLKREELAEAERLAREAIAEAQPSDTVLLLADALAALGAVMRSAGAPSEAAPPLRRALEIYEAKGDVVSAGSQRAALRAMERAERQA